MTRGPDPTRARTADTRIGRLTDEMDGSAKFRLLWS